jgi:hypothetical protein
VWQFQHLGKPFFLGFTKLFDSDPIVRSTNQCTQGNEENITEFVSLAAIKARVRNRGKMVNNRSGWMTFHQATKIFAKNFQSGILSIVF